LNGDRENIFKQSVKQDKLLNLTLSEQEVMAIISTLQHAYNMFRMGEDIFIEKKDALSTEEMRLKASNTMALITRLIVESGQYTEESFDNLN